MKKGKQKIENDKKDKSKKPTNTEDSKLKKKGQNEIEKSDITNKPTRGLAIGDNFGWTGKLPATLLHEHCQKQKWGKVNFDMKKSSKGFTGVVNMSSVDPKTKETIQILMIPESDLYQPKETTNEARHFAATYALYRINYIKNMKMVLPKIFRDYWSDMDAKRLEMLKSNKEKHDRIYNANPFAVYLAEKDRLEKKEKEKKIREYNEAKVRKPAISLSTNTGKSKESVHNLNDQNQEILIAEKMHSFPKKTWSTAPFIDFPSDIRVSIENSVKLHLLWMIQDKKLLKDSDNQGAILNTLKKLGFRESHIVESFRYTTCFVDALEWLIFHIPEDDLPIAFTKSDDESGVSLTISKDIGLDNLVRKMTESGCDKDTILTQLYECNNDEIQTAVKLTQQLIGSVPFEEFEESDSSQSIWEEEIELLKLIGSNKITFCDGLNNKVILVDINAENIEKDLLSLKLYKSDHYPNELPGIQIIAKKNSVKIPNYIKLSILRGLSAHIVTNGYLGECFIHVIIEWLEENISKTIENPGSLLQENVAQQKSSNIKPMNSSKNHNRRKNFNLTSNEKVIEEIKMEYSKRKQSPQLELSMSARKKLPAWNKRNDLISMINNNRVTLITGETGSGKSTQVVQFILDDLYANGNFKTRIICTQPRRISSIGLAERVSEERLDKVGQEVGYIIRGENKTNPKTRITFITTGVLLRMLQSYSSNKNDGMFEDLQYIFIDEVHERSVDSDFLLIVLKRLLKKNTNVKIILMSATINVDKFKDFFSTPVNHIHIEGRTFPIDDFYLDDILDSINYKMITYTGDIIEPKADSNFFKSGNINYDLISKLCLNIDEDLRNNNDSGSILIFLPGVLEINLCIRHIVEDFNKENRDCWCLPLHSALSSNEQKRVFKLSNSSRKIVVSTNVAETSITIPDCTVVIDSGRAKTLHYDSKNNTSKLIEDWCSQAELFQRRGRSGRIKNGKCYHLYTLDTQGSMLQQPIPEIKRTRLENLYLVVKAMGISNVEQFLNSGLDAPDQRMLIAAKKLLNEIGALSNDGLSNLGRYLSYLPTDLKSGKLLILGCIFGCLDVCLTLAAVSSTGSPFLNIFDQRDKIKRIQAKFSNNQGDLLAIANAFTEYEKLKASGKNTKKFISENLLSYTILKDIRSTREQYISLLKDLGFIPIRYQKDDNEFKYLNKNIKNDAILKAVLTGAYYPHIARVQTETKFFQSSVGAIEKENDVKLTRFWVRNEEFIEKVRNNVDLDNTLPANRVFIHPSSVLVQNVSQNNYESQIESYVKEDGTVDVEKAREMYDFSPQVTTGNPLFKAPFILYGNSQHTSKLFLRDITPTSTLATLLFGGDIQYDIASAVTTGKKLPGIVLDEWLPIRTWCKNGVLIKRLRILLDGLIDERLSNPNETTKDQDLLEVFEKAISTIT